MEKMKQENQKNDEDDKIEVFEKYKNLSVDKKKLYCLYLIIIILIIQTALPYIFKTSNTIYISNGSGEYIEYDISKFKKINYTDIPYIANSSETQLVFIGACNDINCASFIPVLKQAQDDYGYKTNYIDIKNITEEGKNIILQFDTEDKFIEKAFGQVPMILTFKNGKMIQGWVGYSDYNTFKEFLEKSGFKNK